MTLFSHFKSDQIWMVLVQREDRSQRIENWLAPAGRDGVRRIFRNMKPDRVPLAAIALKDLGQVKRVRGGIGQGILARIMGHEQAVFVMGNDDGSSQIVAQRGRSVQDAVAKSGHGSAAVCAFSMHRVHSHIWSMRRLLDNQDVDAIDVNLLNSNGLPLPDPFDDIQPSTPMPTIWTKQSPGENDE